MSMQSLFLLGRQPELGAAELESLFGADVLHPIPGGAVLADIEPGDVPFARLGGAIRHCKVLTTLPTTEWKEIERYLTKTTPEHAAYINGKLTLGISVYGLGVSGKHIERTCLTLKKLIRAEGIPVRIVMGKSHELSTPQVIHNNLTSDNGWELVLYRNGHETILAQTVHIQDIESYSARDQARPRRDARVGMLPPKLAQMIINLAVGKLETQNSELRTILDPFCGTGVILQEASLMGYQVYGSDLEPRMIEYSTENLRWLDGTFGITTDSTLEVGDAIKHGWQHADYIHTVACEGYLGTAFSQVPADKYLRESIETCDRIMTGTLQNLHRQLKNGTRLCIGMPAWFISGRAKHLPCLQNLSQLGYTRVAFSHVRTHDLIYHREDQIVGRELVVLIKTDK